MIPTRDDVERARETIGDRLPRTPMLANRTIGEEPAHAGAIVVPVGGGGLISGIQTAIGDRMRVIAVEPETSTALHTGLEHGAPTHVTPASIADGLNAPFAGALALEICASL